MYETPGGDEEEQELVLREGEKEKEMKLDDERRERGMDSQL